MEKKTWSQLLELIDFALADGTAPEIETEEVWENIYRLSQFHKIQSLIFHAVQKLPKEQRPPESILKKIQQAGSLEIARDTVQKAAQMELLTAFEKAGIAVLLLKGFLIKQFYPDTSMRMMADLDILFPVEKEKETEGVLTALGYVCEHKDSHHSVYMRHPFMNIEMHYNMIGNDSLLDAYYDNIWERLELEPGMSYIYRLKWEDFYIFMIAHLAKHFQSGGSGIRSVIDVQQFLDKMEEKLDWKYIDEELRKIELTQFEQHMKNLTAIWFGGEKETEFYAQLREFIQNSGIYGTLENLGVQRAVRAGRKGWKGKMQMWLNVIFLPYKEMKMQYPYLLKCPVLLPIAWIQRFFRIIFLRRKKAKRILSSMNAESDVVKAHQELFEKLGF